MEQNKKTTDKITGEDYLALYKRSNGKSLKQICKEHNVNYEDILMMRGLYWSLPVFENKPEKQTAVRWLIKFLFKIRNPTLNQMEIMKKAEEMEYQQMEEAWKASEANMRNTFSSSSYKEVTFKDWFVNRIKNNK